MTLPDQFAFDGCVRSKALLLEFVHSQKVHKVIGRDMVNKIVVFLVESVFVVEENFCRDNFIKIMRAFDAWSNTKLEGTNCGTKCSEFHVKPHMSVAEATKMLFGRMLTETK